MPHSSRTAPGGTVTYSIWVWSTVTARRVTASVASSAHAMRSPQFTLCPAIHRTRCSIGRLPANQAFELMVTDRVRTAAIPGAPITLTVTVNAASLSPAVASISTAVSKVRRMSTTTPVPTLPPTTLAPIPSATITPPGLTGLFPVVTPSAAARSKHTHKPIRIAQTSSALPLDSRLIGGQLAGLAVLAAAITMVVARLSLRTPQPGSPGPAGQPAKADRGAEGDGGKPAS